MTNKSYRDISDYPKTLKELKKLLEEHKSWKVVEIKYIEESEYIKEKVRVVIHTFEKKEYYHNLILYYDIFTQYIVDDGWNKLKVRINADDIKKQVEKIIEGGTEWERCLN